MVTVQVRGDGGSIPPPVAAAVFRLAQESVTNALRHARQVTRVVVLVEADEAGVRMSVTNDGEVAAYAERFASFAVPRIYTGHCTGLHAAEILIRTLGGAVRNMTTGMTFVI